MMNTKLHERGVGVGTGLDSYGREARKDESNFTVIDLETGRGQDMCYRRLTIADILWHILDLGRSLLIVFLLLIILVRLSLSKPLSR